LNYQDRLLIQELIGSPGIGSIIEGIGFGFLDIGTDLHDMELFGFLHTGNQGEMVGFLCRDTGNTAKDKKFGAGS
jgi:hypothetical protein